MSVTWALSFRISHEAVIKLSARAVFLSEVLTGKGSTAKPTCMITGRIQFP